MRTRVKRVVEMDEEMAVVVDPLTAELLAVQDVLRLACNWWIPDARNPTRTRAAAIANGSTPNLASEG